MRRRIGGLVCAPWVGLLISGCTPGVSPSTPESPGTGLEDVAPNATVAIDSSRCQEGRDRLRPFVVTQDATDQAEIGAATARSLVTVKMTGCELEILPSCQVPGEYRWAATSGSLQQLVMSSEQDLYATLPLGVASLSADLSRGRDVRLRYFVSGVHFASTPSVYRSQLPPGCEQATHFLLNYASGAFEVDMQDRREGGAKAEFAGAGAGARQGKSAQVLYRGGDLASCAQQHASCKAPIRLRLAPLLDGEAPASAPPGREPEALQAAIRLHYPGLRACYDDALGRESKAAGSVRALFTIATDGVVTNLRMQVSEGIDGAMVECARDLFRSMRFKAASGTTDIEYPLLFSPG